MPTFKLTLRYDGTDYVGWQRQASGTSIQGLLEQALEPIAGVSVTVHGAGRTDAGVHALGQVCSVSLPRTMPAATLARALNAVLPADVRVAAIEEIAPDFHARFSATGKHYQYRLVNGPFVSPFIRRYVWHVQAPLDRHAMSIAARMLTGTHDFAAFQGAGSDPYTTMRTIRSSEWHESRSEWGDDMFSLDIEGDGFLRHMVRNIVGTLVAVGLQRWPPDAIGDILASRDRSRSGPTAPASGLFLVRVLY